MNSARRARRASVVVLVDTSIWIAIDRGWTTLSDLIDEDEEIACCPIVLTEVLQGVRAGEYQAVLELLLNMTLLDSPTPLERFEHAARLYLRCRDVGVTPSVPDCLIAACAIAHNVALLHNDTDFLHIARAVPLQQIRADRP